MKTNFFTRVFRFIKARYAPRGARYIFSGSGEDIIMSDILSEFGIKNPFYIDIGAHHPVFGNNTYLFYLKGSRGVLVEPNPTLCELIRSKRPRDICLNAGAGSKDGVTDFFSFPLRSTRSTFSKEQAEEWERSSGQKPEIQKQKILSLETIIDKYSEGRIPDIVSIDAEGLDIEILSGFSWKSRPKIFCVESIIYGKEKEAIHSFMQSHNYALKTQTRSNAIFVDEKI